jgi:hypothetical protein
VSSTVTLDYFRPDFDENKWNIDHEYTLEDSLYLQEIKNLNLTNKVKLRSTAKNSIVTYNAIQKVHRSRIDESRSNCNFSDFSNSFVDYPFLFSSKSGLK